MFAKLQEEIVQGPLEYPRLGRSLVVHPTVGTARPGQFPSQALVVTTAARRLIELSKAGERLQSVIVEGTDKDPTTHPEFHEISQNLRELLNKWYSKAKLVLLSDTPDLALPRSRHALSFYDQPILRLEAGTQKTYAALTGSKPGAFKDVVEQLGRLESERLIVLASFVRGEVDNSKDAEVKAWIRHLNDIKPAIVHITTPAKPQGPKSKPITKTRINQIAELVTTKTGIPVEVCAD